MDNDVKTAIKIICMALKNQGAEINQPKDWMRSLYKRVYGCTRDQIVNGFDEIAYKTKPRLPTIDEIVTAILAEKEKHFMAERQGLDGLVDELEKNNRNNPVAMREIAKMREIMARPEVIRLILS